MPGIPLSMDRVSAEKVYATALVGEDKFLRGVEAKEEVNTELAKVRIATKGKGAHAIDMGIVSGFRVIQYPSYVDVKRATPEELAQYGKLKKSLSESTLFNRKAEPQSAAPSTVQTGPRSTLGTAQSYLSASSRGRPEISSRYAYFSGRHMPRVEKLGMTRSSSVAPAPMFAPLAVEMREAGIQVG